MKRWVWKWIRGDLRGYVVGGRFSKFLDRAAKSVDKLERRSNVKGSDDLDGVTTSSTRHS